jgi:glycolate oxidase iron-sulfur subunit
MNDKPLDNSNNLQIEEGDATLCSGVLSFSVDPQLLARCTRCGLCTSSCPTFLELGDENDGPRGRIQVMRMAAAKGDRTLCLGVLSPLEVLTDRMRRHLELCLDCRACETVCPSGVQYARLIEPLRVALRQAEALKGTGALLKWSCPASQSLSQSHPLFRDWFREIFLYRIFPYSDRLRRLLVPLRFLQRTGVFDLARRMGILGLLPGRLGRMLSLLPAPVRQGPRLPRFLPAVGRRRARVAFFSGCVADALMRHVHWATLRVLQQNGCDIFIPPEQGCCGALAMHSGDARRARQMADANLVAFELERYDAILVNHAGCGAMLKQYGVYWKDGLQPHREKFAAKVEDVHEFLDALGVAPPGGRINATAAYHDSCHLAHAQGIKSAPRRLLGKIPGLQLRDLTESDVCCGSAGVYNIEHAEMADRLAARKLQNILATGASIVLAANAGCMMQIEREARKNGHALKVMHPMQLLDLSYRGAEP